MEKSYLCEIKIGGSFDRCLACEYLGTGCSGPNPNAMEFDRYVEWMNALRTKRKSQGRDVSYQKIADSTDLSKNTVEKFFAGKNKDVSRTTMGRIEQYLIGGDAAWPCAMDLVSERDVVYMDRPETLDALERANKIVDEIHASYKHEIEEIRASYRREMDSIHEANAKEKEALRNEAQVKIEHLLKEIGRMERIINKLLDK